MILLWKNAYRVSISFYPMERNSYGIPRVKRDAVENRQS